MSDRYVDVVIFFSEALNLLQEFILLSDILGLSLLVDSINHPKPANGTEGTVLGPFHTHDAEQHSHGDSISHDPQGEGCLVVCTVKDTSGHPVSGVKIDIWETDSTGHYDVQYPGRDQPDGRAVITSDENGDFWFKAIVPVPYPIPHDVCTCPLARDHRQENQLLLTRQLGPRRQAS